MHTVEIIQLFERVVEWMEELPLEKKIECRLAGLVGKDQSSRQHVSGYCNMHIKRKAQENHRRLKYGALGVHAVTLQRSRSDIKEWLHSLYQIPGPVHTAVSPKAAYYFQIELRS